ncbi:MAG: hypothetical protein IT173_03225 [Acidobacteria bacterium]|nr:hypothetical protein [Acidobacteriota bacterium]
MKRCLGFFSGDEPAAAILSQPPAIAFGLTCTTYDAELKTAILQPPATAGGSDSAGHAQDCVL